MYIAEVWGNVGLIANASNAVAMWNLRNLGVKKQLKLVLYAVNARGRSEHVTFTITTTPKLAPRTGKLLILNTRYNIFSTINATGLTLLGNSYTSAA